MNPNLVVWQQMSAFEAERAQVRIRRARLAVSRTERLLQKIDQSRSAISTCIGAGDFDGASHSLFEQRRQISELQRALSDAQIESLRERAAEFFSLPLVTTPDGTQQVPLRPAIVYCDPPWAYQTKTHAMGTRTQYDSLSDAELAALPVAGLAAEDAVLLMWVTLPKLQAAHRIIEAWGFEFRAVFLVWNKVARYYGRTPRSKSMYTRPNAELLLLAIRGSVPSLKLNAPNMHSNVLQTRPDDHSHKPDIVRQLIVETFGDLPRIELFARQTEPDWLAWGNEIAGSITTKTAHAVNIATDIRGRRKRQTGDSIKRELMARNKRAACGDGDRPTGSVRAETTMRHLERYEQYNEHSHNKVALICAPGDEMLEHQRTRTRFVALLDHPCVDDLPREPLSAYLSPLDLFNTNTLVPELRPTSRVYPRLGAAELADNMPLIKRVQSHNSDIVFANANHIPPPVFDQQQQQ